MSLQSKLLIFSAGMLLSSSITAQQAIPIQDLSFWKPTNASNWRVAGKVSAALYEDDVMTTEKGTGMLVNLPDDKNRANLQSAAEYGDVNVSFDFMMAQNSNSGFYLQGRYEVQLLDSWGHDRVTYGDCGGIYARRKFTPGETMFDGHAPRQNACLAPGLWQTMEISFQAPRFDVAGNKTANAKMVYVRLNGITVQENVELTGPTGGPISEMEATKGPFMIQGDHGPVAFRNFKIKEVGGMPPKAGPVDYEVFYGNFREISEFKDKKPDLAGTNDLLSWEVARKENGFALLSKMNLTIRQPGKYIFTLQAGGNNRLVVNGQELLTRKWTYSGETRSAEISLTPGQTSVEILCYKMDDWMQPMLAFWVESPDGAKGTYHALSSALALTPSDPILLDASTPKVFRSFIDYSENGSFKKRIVHAVNVGHPDGLHYTYDLDNGAMAQMWKGYFLNTSPMWDNRGDGSSQPRGVLQGIGDMPVITTKQGLADTSYVPREEAAFRTLGYDLEGEGIPVFRYQVYGSEINDRIRVEDKKGYARTIQFAGTPSSTPLYCRLAVSTSIEAIDKDLYAVDDRSYYIRLPKGTKAEILQQNGKMVLYLPFVGTVNYSIIF